MDQEQSQIEMTDEEVVVRALQERSFFGHIVERYEAKLNRYLRRLGVVNPDDQLDLLQEIFIKVYRNLNGFDTNLSFSSWIYRIAHNEVMSWYRKRNVRPEGHLVADSNEIITFLSTKTESQEAMFDKKINADVVAEALGRLEPKYRDPLTLRFFENKEYEEISDILQIPVGSVGTLIHRGKKRLQELIEPNSIHLS